MSEILKIFVPTHNVSIKDNDTFVPIQVGAELHKDMDLCPLKDNTGDNISDRNGYYCKLTAIYWVWKNYKKVYPNLKYVGFCHYRRWFDFGNDADIILNNPDQYFDNDQKIILFNKEGYGLKSIRWCYYSDHLYQDFDMDMDIIHDTDQPFYEFCKEYFNTKNTLFYGKNSFIMSVGNFERYCSFMFGLLFEHDKRFGITPQNYKNHSDKCQQESPYLILDRNDQARFNGFTSERIGSAWFLFNHFDIHSYPYVWNNKYDISQTPVDYLHVSSRRFNPLIIRNNINRVHNIGLAHNNRAAIIRRFIKK